MESVTIKDIARICKVGVSTVSRAINNHPDINPETKEMIMKTIKEYDYIPNNSARNLKRSDSKTIAVLIKGISNPFFANMIKILEQEIQKKKYSFVLHRVDEMEDEVDIAIEIIKEKRLRGIVFLGGYFFHSKEKLEKLTVPFVLSTVGAPSMLGDVRCSSVSVDDFLESKKMVSYLCDQGHKRILILAASSRDESIGKLRLDGYKSALEDRGICMDESLIVPMREDVESYTMENGYLNMQSVLQSELDFTAVYAIADSLAIGASKAILEAGKKIPEEISVAGFDGLDMAQYYYPTITTLRQPVEDMAYATSKLLFRMIKEKDFVEQMIFEGTLIEGGSTRKR